MKHLILILTSLFTIHHSAAAEQRTTEGSASPPPNILLILSDDHAQHALSCYGNKHIKTPSLDRIAKEGMRFDHALTPNSFCTPARAAVLTGKYSHKNGVTRLNQLFDGSQQTFPKLLQKAGYNTALFGKWHLLSQPTGFDHYCVMKMQGMPMDPIVFEPQHKWIPWSPKDQKTFNKGGRRLKGFNNDAITDEALAVVGAKTRQNQTLLPAAAPQATPRALRAGPSWV